MIDQFENIEKEILEYCYLTILSLGDYYHNFTINELKNDNKFKEINENKILYNIEQLNEANYIKIRPLPRKFDFRITLEGILFLERFYIREKQIFITITVDVLDFLKRVEDKVIKLDSGEGEQVGTFPFLDFLDNIGRTEKEQNKLLFVIREISNFSKGEDFVYYNTFGGGKEKLRFFSTLLLTRKGRKFLNYYKKLRNLFQTIKDDYAREIILEEYNDIEYLRKREKWKDAIIKMGTIIEYLITHYIREKKLDKEKVNILKNGKEKAINKLSEASFEDKVSYIIQKEVFGNEYNNDWKVVERLIKDLRDCIHLQKYIAIRTRINEEMFNRIYPIFEKLILLF
ncbi:MAG: hypothetical protein ACFE91_13415 [Promethearchaeota archaeon]